MSLEDTLSYLEEIGQQAPPDKLAERTAQIEKREANFQRSALGKLLEQKHPGLFGRISNVLYQVRLNWERLPKAVANVGGGKEHQYGPNEVENVVTIILNASERYHRNDAWGIWSMVDRKEAEKLLGRPVFPVDLDEDPLTENEWETLEAEGFARFETGVTDVAETEAGLLRCLKLLEDYMQQYASPSENH